MINEETYLKCNYLQGMSDNECFINFKGSLQRGNGINGYHIVLKDKVIVKDKFSGLVSILVARKDEKTSQILINGAMDVGAGVYFTVPNEEIVFKEN